MVPKDMVRGWGVEWFIKNKIEQGQWTETQKYPWRNANMHKGL